MITSNKYIIDYVGVRSQEKIMDVWRGKEGGIAALLLVIRKYKEKAYNFFFSLMKSTRSVFFEKTC